MLTDDLPWEGHIKRTNRLPSVNKTYPIGRLWVEKYNNYNWGTPQVLEPCLLSLTLLCTLCLDRTTTDFYQNANVRVNKLFSIQLILYVCMLCSMLWNINKCTYKHCHDGMIHIVVDAFFFTYTQHLCQAILMCQWFVFITYHGIRSSPT